MSKEFDFIWPQGEDLTLSILYERGNDESTLSPVDLSGQDARMDIRGSDRALLITLNSVDIEDTDPEQPGNQPDTHHEITLDAFGNITVFCNRSYSLPGGGVYPYIVAGNNIFDYDLFIRGTAGDQFQLVHGKILVTRSATLWS